jgi:hypothetical protein
MKLVEMIRNIIGLFGFGHVYINLWSICLICGTVAREGGGLRVT